MKQVRENNKVKVKSVQIKIGQQWCETVKVRNIIKMTPGKPSATSGKPSVTVVTDCKLTTTNKSQTLKKTDQSKKLSFDIPILLTRKTKLPIIRSNVPILPIKMTPITRRNGGVFCPLLTTRPKRSNKPVPKKSSWTSNVSLW